MAGQFIFFHIEFQKCTEPTGLYHKIVKYFEMNSIHHSTVQVIKDSVSQLADPNIEGHL